MRGMYAEQGGLVSGDQDKIQHMVILAILYFKRSVASGVCSSNCRDTAGQEKYRSLASMYYKGAECAIVAYDVTNRESFEQAKQYWVSEVEAQLGKNPCLCLAANKADIINERVVSEEEGAAFALSRGASYFETSAKTDMNVTDMFDDIAGRLPSNEGPGFDRTKTYSLGGSSATRETQEQSAGSMLLSFCC